MRRAGRPVLPTWSVDGTGPTALTRRLPHCRRLSSADPLCTRIRTESERPVSTRAWLGQMARSVPWLTIFGVRVADPGRDGEYRHRSRGVVVSSGEPVDVFGGLPDPG